ncbi:MAG TPA: hypothetical protein VEV41_07470, partial [Terriglobales bacterium]|nr:hypothetical protein [Terriglobales bacterium]
PLNMRTRVVVVVAALFLAIAVLLPLWHMTLYSNQYTDGLNLYIYTHKLVGGAVQGDRDDLKEINTLNHYIGMHPLQSEDFHEFKWMPLALGILVLLALRAVVLGRMSNLVDVTVAMVWFGLFSLWSFYSKLYTYGHNLEPDAPVKVAPFTPPMLGSKQLANFTVFNYPATGSYLILLALLLLVAGIFLSSRQRHTKL